MDLSRYIYHKLVDYRHAVEASQRDRESDRSPTSRVLLVDDDPDALEGLEMWLRLRGFKVRSAPDGTTALTVAQEFQPGVLILDIELPDINGYEVARRMRLQPALRQALLIALTARGQAQDIRRARCAGFNHHLVKPANLERLYTLIRSQQPMASRAADASRNP